ncbi:hypothetical protein [Halogranum rubrum]|uniref:Uncharacterized protein n=1 Tax=Halogranum salarium B-1 TaxID=1210908 RepID=J3A7E3_9EURY|nr:hypothetical protein [Halogranum salarium]EJN61523.1 hypothetical protein HSB1_05640 [Halogranum salarium B-1]
MSRGLFDRAREFRQWVSALSAVRRLALLFGSSGVFYITQGIATAEEQEAVVVLATGGLSAVSALVALYSVYVVLRPFISGGSSDDAEVE